VLHIGRYRIRELSDGLFRLDGGAMFGVVPKVLWSKLCAADEQNRVELALRCLLVEGAGRRVLLDAGIGEKWSPREVDMYAIDHAAGELRRSLAHLGVAVEDVTDVVVTHLHFDHAGGLTRSDGNGRLALSFPNARVHVQRDHFAWAQHPTEKDRASFRAENYALLESAGKLVLHDGDAEVAPGLRIRRGGGHTVGHQMIQIDDRGDGLVFTGDTLPTAAHLKPAYVMGYDLFPLATLEEKKKILDEVFARGLVLAFDHEPKFAACRLARDARGDYVVGERVAL
jgi:glyoxylase-like metal-dependent hydrolase (beta-lactamase superfamily II)